MARLARRVAPSLLVLAAGAGCNSAPSGTIQLVSEADAFTQPPAPVRLQVTSVDSSGNTTTLATATLPTTTIDLGSLDINTLATVVVTGTDAAGDQVLFGESIPVAYGSLQSTTMPIFVQRPGQFARLPNPLSDSRTSPVLAAVAARLLFVAGGDDPSPGSTALLYDFGQLAPITPSVTLPFSPKSVAFVDEIGLLIDDDGASQIDLGNPGNAPTTVPAPAGASFADVSGGATILASDGTQYVVGATRTTGAPTAAVLAVDPTQGQLSWMTLSTPRLGAAAAWVDGRGLVVAGGSTTGAGVEIIGVGTGSTTGSALAYPPDSTAGGGASALDGQHVVIAGGVDASGTAGGVRTIDLGCTAQCAPSSWTALPAPLVTTQVFASSAERAFVVGDTADGTTHAYDVQPNAATEIPTKVAHTRARAIVSPIGTVVLFGGAGEIESFIPQL